MANRSKDITTERVAEWMASTGFIFPRNELELTRFEKLHGKPEAGIVSSAFSAERIVNNAFREEKVKQINFIEEKTRIEFKMVARNMADLPQHILDRMVKNQQKPKDDNDGEPK